MPTWIERFKPASRESTRATHLSKGEEAEQQAASFLQTQGLTLVTKNFRAQGGEIDLIMRDGEHLVFVEVRFRKQHGYGSASETVDFRKQQKLSKTAEQYLQEHRLTDKVPCRFDVIGINQSQLNDQPAIDWIKNAF